MEKNKVVFLDRDGTINKDFGYVYKKENFEFLPKAIDGLKELIESGYKLIIITNQSGIGRGYYKEEDYKVLTKYIIEELKKYDIYIDEIYYCPHTDNDNCNCRKPKLKLFYDAIKKYNIDLDNSFAIGDKIRDLSICEETAIKGILIDKNSTTNKYKKVNNLLEAADFIVKGN